MRFSWYQLSDFRWVIFLHNMTKAIHALQYFVYRDSSCHIRLLCYKWAMVAKHSSRNVMEMFVNELINFSWNHVFILNPIFTCQIEAVAVAL